MRISDWSSDVCSSDLMLARSAKARTIVEFGTSFGISTLHLAAALWDNGGGRLITSEFEPSKVVRAREHLRSEEHTSELQSLMRISYAVFCLKKKNKNTKLNNQHRMQ